MRLQQPVYRARLAATAATLVLISATTSLPAFGQTGQLRLIGAIQSAAADTTAQQSMETVRRLSIDEATTLALEQNLGIRIQRMDPQIQDVGVALARSSWAPSLTTSISRTSQTQQATSALSGGATSIDNGAFATAVGISQTMRWGGNYTANWNSARASTTNLFSSFSPQLNSTLNVSVTQPLRALAATSTIRPLLCVSGQSRSAVRTYAPSITSASTSRDVSVSWNAELSTSRLIWPTHSCVGTRSVLRTRS